MIEKSILIVVSALLAFLPMLMAAFFLAFTLPRKLLAVKQGLAKLKRTDGYADKDGPDSRYIASGEDVEALAQQYYGRLTLSLPALLLTLFYIAGFSICDSYLGVRFQPGSRPWFFPSALLLAAKPLGYAYLGVYAFNLGAFVRRIYLGDLNEQVFWAALNRLLLSMSLALVLMNSGLLTVASSPVVLFSVGFLANVLLEGLLSRAIQFLNIGKPRTEDLPLQMVKGIDRWKEYRLEEEGIENVQNLATADVVELTVRTHYSLRTLIDWIDQAILLVRLTSEHVTILGTQTIGISAIEFGAASPKATGSADVANSLAEKLSVSPVLMAMTMNSLFEDAYVQALWSLWQRDDDEFKRAA